MSKLYFKEWLKVILADSQSFDNHYKRCSLSFDDGPNETTLQVLRILRRYKVTGTFFWITQNVRNLIKHNPKLYKLILSEIKTHSHEIGYHGPYDFVPNLRIRLFGKYEEKEFNEGLYDLRKLTCMRVGLFRPHNFQFGASIIYATKLGLKTVYGDLFHFAQPDWPVWIQIQIMSKIRSGSILILHDGTSIQRQKTFVLDLLPILINILQKKEYIFVRVSNNIQRM